MEYLGETKVSVEDTPYANYTQLDWVLYFLEYGHFDGDHHKQWAIDQATRVIKGTGVVIKKATWDDGTIEYRVSTIEPPSDEYKKYVADYMSGEDGPSTYSYDEGVAP